MIGICIDGWFISESTAIIFFAITNRFFFALAEVSGDLSFAKYFFPDFCQTRPDQDQDKTRNQE